MGMESLAERVLAADPTILRVLVLSATGEELAHVYSETYSEKARLGGEVETRFGEIDSLTIAMFAQAEKNYGTMEFILLAFKEAKVMLLRNGKLGVYLALRIRRSADAEYLRTILEPIFNGS
jgi:hypothetical protein